jgi:hypothetical protein
MSAEDLTIDYLWGRDDLATDAAFHCDGTGSSLTAVLALGERSVAVYCVGIMRLWDRRDGGSLIRNTDALLTAGVRTDEGLDEALRAGDLEFENNPWFSFLDEDGEDIGYITHTIDAAVSFASAYLGGEIDVE